MQVRSVAGFDEGAQSDEGAHSATGPIAGFDGEVPATAER
jgi:hypothetical protein